MSLQQIKRELESLKLKMSFHNSQVECYLSSAKEDLNKEISRISARIQESGEVFALTESDKTELFNSILESCNESVNSPYFRRWAGGL